MVKDFGKDSQQKYLSFLRDHRVKWIKDSNKVEEKKIELVCDGVFKPFHCFDQDAGLDLFCQEDVVLQPNEKKK